MMKYKKPISRIGILCLAVLLLACTGCSFGKDKDTTSADTTVTPSQADPNILEWQGKRYTYNTNIQTVLFMGIDQDEAFQEEYLAGDAGQADCIMLLVYDKETEEAKVIQINRNTMAELDLYDLNGNQGGSKMGQLCLQYAYNIGGSSSCWSMVQTVRDVMCDIDIDGYFAMDMAGIQQINDALGGVDVTMKEDYTMIHESFRQGETVHLEGDLAERFLRYRDLEEFDSATKRMDRQVDYVSAMLTSMREKGMSGLYDMLVPYLDVYILTNLSADQLNGLTTYDYQLDDVEMLPGETIQGEIYEEYHLDDDAVLELVMNTFYIEVE